MTPERWKQVSLIYEGALTRGAVERVAFLTEACAGDASLQREVQALLDQPTSPRGLEGLTPSAIARAMGDDAGAGLTGRRFGVYLVHERIGVGGMGEVYRARDTRLGRDVAIKVLPAAFANDADRLARFEREARVLASLDHPHIGTIHGVEESEGVRALVLALVEGETLAERLERGPLPMAEALEYARQIADALEAAHEKGITHRDLKPGNIKITPAGVVKVLDFGLAKADGVSSSAALAVTLPAKATGSGVVLGTAAYMSPEQARGQAVDKRTDIWAFGCVLYETLTGEIAFRGETISDTIAAVLDREPKWTALPTAIPTNIRQLLERCLQKDAKRRLRDIGDARIEIDDALNGSVSGPEAHVRELRSRKYVIGLVTVVAAAIAALVAVSIAASRAIWPPDAPAAAPIVRTAIDLPAGWRLSSDSRIAVSSDGTTLAFVAVRDLTSQIFVRRLDAIDAHAINGTRGALHPFFSADGQWLAFVASGALQRVSLAGGAPLRICDVSGVVSGGAWGANDTIVYALRGTGLFRVNVAKGTPEPIPESGPASWPEFLPDGERVLYTTQSNVGDQPAFAVISADGSSKQIVAALAGGEGATSAEGVLGAGDSGGLGQATMVGSYLVYGQSPGFVRALPVDPTSLRAAGPPVPLADSVERGANAGPVAFAVSRAGMLLYATTGEGHQLVWVDRRGNVTPISEDRAAFRRPRVSPDGHRIAVAVNDAETRRSDVWIYDGERGTKTRLTTESHNLSPVWAPDGRSILVSVWAPDGRSIPMSALREFSVDRSAGSTALLPLDVIRSRLPAGTNPYPSSWSPDGRTVLFQADDHDIWALTRGADKPVPVLSRGADDRRGQFSPEGRAIVYASNESGQEEIYAASWPTLSGKTPLSTDGGNEPQWSRDGREVFYRRGNAMMVAGLEAIAGGGFRVAPPRQLFSGDFTGTARDQSFDVSPDGQRFVMVRSDERAALRQLTVVQNWAAALTKAPAAK